MRFLAALGFLTIIPIPYRRQISAEEVGRSTVYFPVVGLIIGLILAGLNWLFGLFLPAAVANVLLIAAVVVISGALHLDGLVDTCDGIAGHGTVADRWRAMQDSRAGAFGIVGVVLLLLVKYVSLTSVPVTLMMTTLVLMPVLSRWAMVYAVFAFPYARPAGLGTAFKKGTGWRELALSTVITLVVTIGLARFADWTYFYLVGLVIMFAVWLIVILMANYLQRKLSGLTGDTYGAINEIAEVAVLILVSLLAHNRWFI